MKDKIPTLGEKKERKREGEKKEGRDRQRGREERMNWSIAS